MTPELQKYIQDHDRDITIQYPEQFDPKWIVTESG